MSAGAGVCPCCSVITTNAYSCDTCWIKYSKKLQLMFGPRDWSKYDLIRKTLASFVGKNWPHDGTPLRDATAKPAEPSAKTTVNISDWRTWRDTSMKAGDCPCCIPRQQCDYHRETVRAR